MGLGCQCEPKVVPNGLRGNYCKVSNRHIIGHVLVWQNEGSTQGFQCAGVGGSTDGRRQGGRVFPAARDDEKEFFQRGCFSNDRKRREGTFPTRGGGPTYGRQWQWEKNWTEWFGGNRLVYSICRLDPQFNWPNSDSTTFLPKWLEPWPIHG